MMFPGTTTAGVFNTTGNGNAPFKFDSLIVYTGAKPEE